ncbi:MAG: hypothetical protein [Caudoviricetes sp.]|nr:MAG: hypothetical protein [Caudoviricetes sp.]
MDNNIKKLIDKKIIKKNTVLTVIFLKKYIDSFQFMMVEDTFIINDLVKYDIYATSITDFINTKIKYEDIILIDGMEISRLAKAYGV